MGIDPRTSVCPSVRVRRMGLQDLPFVVEAHLAHFPDGFFARLGRGFLTRYYRTFLDGPLATAIVAEIDGVATGYLAGILRGPEHRQLMLQHHGVALVLAGAGGMVRHPTVGLTFFVTRLGRYASAIRRHRRGAPSGAAPTTRPAVLSHIVVAQPRRCRGMGSTLIDRFLKEAREAGRTHACLVTMEGELGAGSFYERRGWRRAGDTTQADGRMLRRYEYALYPQDPTSSEEDRNS